MQHISKVLESSRKSTPGRTSSYSEEPVPAEITEGSDEWITQKLKLLNVSSLEHTFESFKPDAETIKAFDILQALVNGELKKKFILIYGRTGSGKTHLLEATILGWAEQNKWSYYTTFSEIARSLKTALRRGGEFYDSKFDSYSSRTRLIVDDYGMGTTESRFEVSDLEDIIDKRYRRRYYPDNEEVTLLSTNKDITDLPERIVSRFYDPEFGVVICTGDKDYRRRRPDAKTNDTGQ